VARCDVTASRRTVDWAYAHRDGSLARLSPSD
jgi:hypothetical protein